MKTRRLIFPLALSLLSFLLAPATAAFKGGHVKARLLAESTSIQPGRPFWVGVELEMDPPWHTYWKNPGEAGEPTSIRWTLPAGFSAGPITWPAPAVIAIPPVTSYGYAGRVLLLTEITPPASLPSGSAPLKAHVSWLECADVCVPGGGDVALKLPVKPGPPAPDPANAPLFAETRFRLPLENSGWTAEATDAGRSFHLTLTPPPGETTDIRALRFFGEEPGVISPSGEQRLSRKGRAYLLDVPKADSLDHPVESLAGLVLATPGWRGDGSEPAIRVSPAVKAAGSGMGLAVALLFAFIGGLILNLMPCVLPVLSIKVLGFVQQAHGDRRIARNEGFLFGFGVLLSFWFLAGLLLAARAGGRGLGWGFQLQSPRVVYFLAALFFALALNLFGLFEIGVSLTRAAGATRSSRPYGGAFLNGVLATVVATPCTAPFMGSALGFALVRPPAEAFAVFTALAAGMAMPVVLLASAPGLLRLVPKPGAWMENFKAVLGFLMAATVVWLLWVLGQQAGADGMAIALGSFVPLAAGLWLYGRSALSAPVRRLIATTIGVVLAVGGITGGAWAIRAATPAAAIASGPNTALAWQPYSADAVAAAVNGGRPAFLDFSAAWCLSCQVNERVALAAPSVAQAFSQSNVALFKADWTSKDPKIASVLQSFGRSGVPLYVVYRPNAPASPTLLPAVLTPGIVVDAVRAASASHSPSNKGDAS